MFKTSDKIHIGKYSVDIIVFVRNITDGCILGSDFSDKDGVSNLIYKLFVDAPISINSITDFQVCARIVNPEDNIPETLKEVFEKNSIGLDSTQKEKFAQLLIKFEDIFDHTNVIRKCDLRGCEYISRKYQ